MGRYMSKKEKAAMKADLEKRQAASRTRAGKAAAMGKGNEPKQLRTPKKRPSEPLEKFKQGWALPKEKPAKGETETETGNTKLPSGRALTDKEQKALDAANEKASKVQQGNTRREEFSAKLAEQRAAGRAGRAAQIAGGK
jgi:hypothetical protein